MSGIKKIITAVIALIYAAGTGTAIYVLMKKTAKITRMSKAYKQYYYLTMQWLVNNRSGDKIIKTLSKNGYKSIGIYGLGSIASIVIDEIEGSDIKIKFIADKNNDSFIEDDVFVISPSEIINYYDDIDAIIVTPIAYYDEIYNELDKLNVSEKLVSLQDIIFDN